MTSPEDEKAVLELRLRVEEKGPYVKLSEGLEHHGQESEQEKEDEAPSYPFWFWVKLALLFTFLVALAVVGYIWVGPLIMDKVWLDFHQIQFWIFPIDDFLSYSFIKAMHVSYILELATGLVFLCVAVSSKF